MINTNYLGMRFGAFEVISYKIHMENETIVLKLKCTNCGQYKIIRLSYERVLKIKCVGCGRLDIVIPIEYYPNSKMVKDTITIGAYRYRKLRTQYIKGNRDKAEIDFIRENIYEEKGEGTKK